MLIYVFRFVAYGPPPWRQHRLLLLRNSIRWCLLTRSPGSQCSLIFRQVDIFRVSSQIKHICECSTLDFILDDIQTRFQYRWVNYDGKWSRKASQIKKHKYSSHSQEVKTQSAGWFWFHPLTGITALSLNPPFVFHGWIKHGHPVSCQSLPQHQGKAKLGGHFCSTTLLTRVNYAINMCLLPPVREHRISRRPPAATTACPHITCWFWGFVLGPPLT